MLMAGMKWMRWRSSSIQISDKKGRVTVTHPKKDTPIGTVKNIEKQSGIKFT